MNVIEFYLQNEYDLELDCHKLHTRLSEKLGLVSYADNTNYNLFFCYFIHYYLFERMILLWICIGLHLGMVSFQ